MSATIPNYIHTHTHGRYVNRPLGRNKIFPSLLSSLLQKVRDVIAFWRLSANERRKWALASPLVFIYYYYIRGKKRDDWKEKEEKKNVTDIYTITRWNLFSFSQLPTWSCHCKSKKEKKRIFFFYFYRSALRSAHTNPIGVSELGDWLLMSKVRLLYNMPSSRGVTILCTHTPQ